MAAEAIRRATEAFKTHASTHAEVAAHVDALLPCLPRLGDAASTNHNALAIYIQIDKLFKLLQHAKYDLPHTQYPVREAVKRFAEQITQVVEEIKGLDEPLGGGDKKIR